MTATISSQLSTEKKASPKAKVIAKAIRIITSTRIYQPINNGTDTNPPIDNGWEDKEGN